MDALATCRHLYESGITLSSDGDRLLAGPVDRLNDELRGLIREHKPGLLQLLSDAHNTADVLLAWAMKTCDGHGDGPAAREQMRVDCLATPPHLHADLLAHFKQINGGKP